jgi:hypothetical protein
MNAENEYVLRIAFNRGQNRSSLLLPYSLWSRSLSITRFWVFLGTAPDNSVYGDTG